MRYIIAVIVGLTILAFSSPVFADDHTWQRPTECADEDRQIWGNRSTPCKYVLPLLIEAEHKVYMYYPNCWEALVFRMPGMKPVPEVRGDIQRFRNNNNDRDGRSIMSIFPENFSVQINAIKYWGYSWGLGHTVSGAASDFPKPWTDRPYVRIEINGSLWSNAVVYPDTTNTVELVNACLALVAQEKANREYIAEVERQEQAEAARLKAERDAAAKEEQQARLTAESQARIAEQQLAIANERRLVIARAEAIKTQTLIDEIALQEVLTAILNDIVRIRLAGQNDRARITNEYLNRARNTSADFETETSEIESRVQKYLDFNAALLTEIAEYQLSIQNRLEALRGSIKEQRAEIDRLEAGAREIAVPAEEPGENVEEDQNGNGNG